MNNKNDKEYGMSDIDLVLLKYTMKGSTYIKVENYLKALEDQSIQNLRATAEKIYNGSIDIGV